VPNVEALLCTVKLILSTEKLRVAIFANLESEFIQKHDLFALNAYQEHIRFIISRNFFPEVF